MAKKLTPLQKEFLDGLSTDPEVWTNCDAKKFATASSLQRRQIVELKFDYTGQGATATRWGFKARRLPEKK